MSCKFPRYTLLRQDSQIPAQRSNGGTVIGFSPTIAYRQYKPQLQNLPEYIIATLYYQHNYITLATIYVRPGHPIPNRFFASISNNFRNYIIMTDINIHSRPDRKKTNFHDFIEYQTNGTVHQLTKPTRPISNTTPDIVITSTNLLNRRSSGSSWK